LLADHYMTKPYSSTRISESCIFAYIVACFKNMPRETAPLSHEVWLNHPYTQLPYMKQ